VASVTLEAVSKVYGHHSAVEDVSLSIEEGEFLVLLGPSGCGKTTALRMIAGLVEPTRGVVRFGRQNVTWLPARKRNVGMVFQDYALFPHMTVAENISFGLRQRGLDKSLIDDRVTALVSLVRLSGFEGRHPEQLSGGQQQRVALARALAYSPAVLLMDEPLGALDLKLREAMQVELRRVQRELGITTIFVTHDQEEAMSLADRIAVMADGRVQQIGTPEDIYRRPVSAFVANFIGKVNFLDGNIVSVSGALCVVALANGAVIETSAPPSCRVGEHIRIALRPENLELSISPAEPMVGQLRATIEQRRYLGNVVHYFVRTGDDEQLVVERADTTPELAVGQNVAVAWRMENALVFPYRDANATR
jgi:putative spermidine/putrescine transport system ATP-binding protein